MTALAPVDMAINNAVADSTGLLPAHVTYGMLSMFWRELVNRQLLKLS